MNKISPQLEEQLIRLIEGKLSEEEMRTFRRELATSPLLNTRYEELLALHEGLKKNSLWQEPSKNFTQRVMANLHHVPAVNVISPRNGLILLAGILVATGIGMIMLATGFFDGTTGTLSLPTTQLPALKEYHLPAIPFNGKRLMEVIIGLNIALAFVLLDRTILKPFFTNRTQHSI